MRSPHLPSGTQWKNVRWSQYSARVQNSQPLAKSASIPGKSTTVCVKPYPKQIAEAGTKSSGTTIGCVLEQKSRKSLSNIRGDSGDAFSIGFASLHGPFASET